MTFYDYLILGFYFAFIIGIGFLFKSFNSNISDYFRGGGSMLWWMCGASTLMGGMSVWSFTGAASKVYETGLIFMILPIGGLIGQISVLIFTCYRFRQMRVITSVEAIRRRYGAANEQFYVWLQLPLGLVGGAIALNTLGVFMSAVFGTNLILTVVVVGLIVIFVASVGGVWAVVAGDFVQMLLLLLVSVVAAFLVLRLPEIGGISGLIHKLPASHFDLTHFTRPGVVSFWVAAIVIQSLFFANDLSAGAARFMSVKDGVHARRAALMSVIISCFFPILIFIPPLASVILFPDLGAHFSELKNPSEAAYVAASLKTMPQGLLGLLVSGIFAAAMASMDVGLNRNAGVFVKNFYHSILRPKASDRELLVASRVFTTIFGLLIVSGGVLIALYRDMNLFDFVIAVGALIGIPLVIPLAWGLFIKNTPSWAAWSTALVGFVVAALTKWHWGPGILASFLGRPVGALNNQEAIDLTFASTVIFVTFFGSVWYLMTMRFARYSSLPYKKEVENFFRQMHTPIDPVAENIAYDDARQYRLIGLLCLIYGGVLVLGIAIPNPMQGRLCFAFVAGGMLLIGWLLYRNYLKGGRRDAEAALKQANILPEELLETPRADTQSDSRG